MATAKAEFSVAVGNPFAGLSEDDTSDNEGQVAAPKSAPAAKPAAPTRGAAAVAPRAAPASRTANERAAPLIDSTEGAVRGGEGRGRGGRGGAPRGRGGVRRQPSDQMGGNANSDEDRPTARQAARGGGEFRGRGGRGGRGRGGDAAAPPRGREFDRHVSGTGRPRGMKKSGAGSHNWGGPVDSWNNQEESGEAAAAAVGTMLSVEERAGAADANASPEEAEYAENGKPRREEEEEEMLTLEEYKKLQAAKRANLPKLPAAEGSSNATQRSELEREGYTLQVKQPDEREVRGKFAAQTAAPDSHERQMRPQDIMSFETQVALHESGRRMRNARGRGRGGAGAGASGRGRGGPPPVNEVEFTELKLNDDDAFPTL